MSSLETIIYPGWVTGVAVQLEDEKLFSFPVSKFSHLSYGSIVPFPRGSVWSGTGRLVQPCSGVFPLLVSGPTPSLDYLCLGLKQAEATQYPHLWTDWFNTVMSLSF